MSIFQGVLMTPWANRRDAEMWNIWALTLGGLCLQLPAQMNACTPIA